MNLVNLFMPYLSIKPNTFKIIRTHVILFSNGLVANINYYAIICRTTAMHNEPTAAINASMNNQFPFQCATNNLAKERCSGCRDIVNSMRAVILLLFTRCRLASRCRLYTYEGKSKSSKTNNINSISVKIPQNLKKSWQLFFGIKMESFY